MKDIFDHIDRNFEKYLEHLFEILRQPSISAQNIGMQECAELVACRFESYGIRAKVLPTNGHPVVYGEAGPEGGPTLLAYGHYDVQPPEPLEQWKSPPFEPTIVGDCIRARGIADDKGQFFCGAAAVAAWKAVRGELPIRVKFIIEGEEEIGSPSMVEFLQAEKERLAADLFVFLDGGIHPEDYPMVNLGLKGMTYVELEARGPKGDTACANDPIVPNPIWRLVWALNTIKAPDGRVLFDGFYDDVRPPDPDEEAALAEMERRIPSSKPGYLERFGLNELLDGVSGPEAMRRVMLSPTCSVDGIWGGYTGTGTKTVLPATAHAKLAMRLVPNQKAGAIYRKLVEHLERHGFGDIQVKLLGALEPCRVPFSNRWVPVVARALEDAYGKPPLVVPSNIAGGSGPDYHFASILNLPTIGLPNSQAKERLAHAPNEYMTIESVKRGIRTSAALFQRMAEAGKEV